MAPFYIFAVLVAIIAAVPPRSRPSSSSRLPAKIPTLLLVPSLLLLIITAAAAATATSATTGPAHSNGKTIRGSICTKADRACISCVKSNKKSHALTCTACSKGSVLIDGRCYCPAGSALAGSKLTAASASTGTKSSSAHSSKSKSKSDPPTCAPCAVNTYASVANLVTTSRCQQCPGGSTTRGATGSSTCYVEAGFYFNPLAQEAKPCPDGYTCAGGDIFAEGQLFVDIDECAAPDSPCLNNGACNNSPGSFACDCQGTGYRGEICQTDIDECAESTPESPACPSSTDICTNTPGSFSCASPTGSLNAAYFKLEGEPSELPDFDSLTPYLVTTVQDLNFELTMGEFANSGLSESVGARFSGFVDVPADGLWTFYLKSDDGSKLWIDDTLLIDHDGLHMMTEKSGQVELTAGLHQIRVDYFEFDEAAGLIVSWSGPDIPSKEVIPTARFSPSA